MKTKQTTMDNFSNRNELAAKYFPLVSKIAAQISKTSGYSFEECRSAGNMGLVYAMNTYKEEQEGKKKQSFLQYAGYMIRFSILNDLNANKNTIRVNIDQRKKLLEEGKNEKLTFSLDKKLGTRKTKDEDECTFADMVRGDEASSIYMSIDPQVDQLWSNIYNILKTTFSKRDCDIFFSTFGINGKKERSGKDMSKKYGISSGAVTQIRNKVISYMRKDDNMREMLLDIMQLNARENYAM